MKNNKYCSLFIITTIFLVLTILLGITLISILNKKEFTSSELIKDSNSLNPIKEQASWKVETVSSARYNRNRNIRSRKNNK